MELSLNLLKEIGKAEISRSPIHLSKLTSVKDLDFKVPITFNGHHSTGDYLNSLSIYYVEFKRELLKILSLPDVKSQLIQLQRIEESLLDLQHTFKKNKPETWLSRTIVDPSLAQKESPICIKDLKENTTVFLQLQHLYLKKARTYFKWAQKKLANPYDTLALKNQTALEFTSKVQANNLSMCLTPRQALELIGALFHCGYIQGTKKDLWDWGKQTFDIHVAQPDSEFNRIKNRNDPSLFLTQLTNEFNDFCNRELEK